MKLTIISLLGMGLSLLPASLHADVDQQQAVEVARKLYASVGAAGHEKGPIPFPADVSVSSTPLQSGVRDTHWQPRWRLLFKDSNARDVASMEIVSATGEVSRFYDYSLSSRLQALRIPPTMGLDKQTAISFAQKALQCTGQSENLRLLYAVEQQITEPATMAGHLWLISFQRTSQGIPYRNQQANIILSAESGEILGLGLTFPSSPVVSFVARAGENDARFLSESLLVDRGLFGYQFVGATTEIVRPNSFWDSGGSPQPSSLASRPAWNCKYQFADVTLEIWVDLEDGRILGGERSVLAKRTRPSRKSLATLDATVFAERQ